MNTSEISTQFLSLESFKGHQFDCQPIPGDVDVLQIKVEGVETIPVYVSASDNQVLCIAYLWTEQDVDPKQREDMLESMLEMNIPIPLSSFSKIDDMYVIFGALSINSSFEDIVHEVITLSENAEDALTAMECYLL